MKTTDLMPVIGVPAHPLAATGDLFQGRTASAAGRRAPFQGRIAPATGTTSPAGVRSDATPIPCGTSMS